MKGHSGRGSCALCVPVKHQLNTSAAELEVKSKSHLNRPEYPGNFRCQTSSALFYTNLVKHTLPAELSFLWFTIFIPTPDKTCSSGHKRHRLILPEDARRFNPTDKSSFSILLSFQPHREVVKNLHAIMNNKG